MIRCLTLVMLTLLPAAIWGADNRPSWPQFRGPAGSGIADGQNPPIEMGPEKNVKWKAPVPSGLSSPIITGELVVITAFENEKLYTIAYDRTSGKEVWRADAQAKQLEVYNQTHGSPTASTPATEGERIVSYFGSCGLVCYDLAGKPLWRFEMPPAATAGGFGSGVSPIIADGTVVLVRDTPQESKIVALDAVTGTLKWEAKRQSPSSYSTPVAWDTPTGKQVVVAGHARMIGYDLKTGAERWSLAGTPSGCCSSPVIAGGTLYFAGWSPGGPDDKETQMPTFDKMLKDMDKDKDGAISREEGGKDFEGMFASMDGNKDNKITSDEWDVILKFMAEGINNAFALKSGGTGDITDSHMLWKKSKGMPYLASAIVYGGQYVMVKDGGIVTAYDEKTGDELYQKRAAATGAYYASPVACAGHIYFTSHDDGTVTVIKAGTTEPEVAAKNPPLGEKVAATPAIAGDTIYIRTAGHLYAFAK
jgi:outer membrane protein assembly factor BamB